MIRFSFMIALMLLSAGPVLAQTGSDTFQSENNNFQVSYESQLEPISINRIHSWVLHVTDADGHAVEDAQITIVGGMPEHNHGLATEPTIEATGDGDYLLQGLRFHMMGYWELVLTVSHDGVSDNVVIPLEL